MCCGAWLSFYSKKVLCNARSIWEFAQLWECISPGQQEADAMVCAALDPLYDACVKS